MNMVDLTEMLKKYKQKTKTYSKQQCRTARFSFLILLYYSTQNTEVQQRNYKVIKEKLIAHFPLKDKTLPRILSKEHENSFN